MGFRYREECYGYSQGQSDCSILGYDGDTQIAHLDVAYHKLKGRKEAYIKMVEVDPSYRGKGVARELIHQLVKSVPYEAIDWGGTTKDGAALKAAMDKEFGTSYTPQESDEEPDPHDPRYEDDLDNSKYFTDLEAWRKRQGYVDESQPSYTGGTTMKTSEIQELVRETVKQVLKEKHIGFDKLEKSLAHKKGVKDPGAVAASIGKKKYGAGAMQKAAAAGKSLGEAGYDQYGAMEETMPSMEEVDETLTFIENANALYEKHVGFKNLVGQLKAKGMSDEKAKETAYHIGVKKYGKEKMAQAAAEHKPLSDKDALKEHGCECDKSEMTYDDGRDAWVCEKCGTSGPNGPVGSMDEQASGFAHEVQDALENLSPEELKAMGQVHFSRGAEAAAKYLQRALPGHLGEEPLDQVADALEELGHKDMAGLTVDYGVGSLAESPPEGWHGTVAAMKQHHPEKFGDGPGKINPYALAHSMANKGDEPHYKDQKSSLHGKPVKKKEMEEEGALYEERFQVPNFFTSLKG